ncbi:oxygen-dependent protoporphyrinogen oxidase [Kushneria sinocarnis]|uniref:Oxygen-dependent protoporphyrinogen oxidase n=1 Tax=Kushneria sinocarnis TaxID=595502 RepID=A0A420WZC2_9GAMM|nr:protoporphyrinogen oxidase [Kushneria sinocarnis]RKR06698.1 oxygen-dependent protoporphyrinogen oxidase [Kushneria sinocarnis]
MEERAPDGEAQDQEVVVVGGGASGLAAARVLAQRGRRVTLLERGAQPGGNISTRRDGEWQTEVGPNTLIMKPPLYQLLSELGLLEEAQPANAEASKRFVALEGQAVALPTRPLKAVTNPLIGVSGWSQIVREPFVRRSRKQEESLADFIARRLGRRVLDHMVDPFVSGVYAGDPARLSAQAAMPRLVALEREYGSLIAGGMARLWQSRRSPPALPQQWRGRLVSFPTGLQRLTDRLAERVLAEPGGAIHCQCEVTAVHRRDDGWEVEDASGRRWRARQLVMAVPAPVAAELLRPIDERLAEPLAAIVYPPVNAVALGFRAQDITHPLDGFGVLIPSVERRRTLGALFSSTIFPGRAPDGYRLLNVFLGGRRQPEAAEGSDDAQVAQAMADLRDLLGIRGNPVWQQVSRWPQAIPQYELGHGDRIAALDQALARHAGLSLIGNWRGGIAVGDCLENGRLLGEQLAAEFE